MTDLYLIAHRVRSEPAFDIATQVPCAECHGMSACKQCGGSGFSGQGSGYGDVCGECGGQSAHGCSECDSLGFWWVVPTSGHRAYPWWSLPLKFDGMTLVMDHNPDKLTWTIFDMPPSLPDHYTTRASPARQSLASLLAIPRPQLKVDRRF